MLLFHISLLNSLTCPQSKEGPQPAVEDEPEPDEDALVALALENAGPGGEQVSGVNGALGAPPNNEAEAQAEEDQ